MSSKGLPPLGPSAQSLANAYAGLNGDDQASLEAELAATRQRLAEEGEKLMRSAAAGLARQSLNNAMLEELKEEAAGKKGVRRLSDPDNRDARIAHIRKVEDDELRRLSGGRLRRKP